MANIKIDRFRVENKDRGKARILGSFDVNFGPMTIRGYEIVQLEDRTFISEPNNAYKNKEGSWTRFNFVLYNGPKGEQIQENIKELAFDELRRRQPAASQPKAQTTGYDDDLPW